jgi:ArsR family transcriptional regulator, arsenate/arsenite/antimonite-responsive transcriptional repressor
VRQLSAEDRARVFKALSDPRRVDIIDHLASGGSMCGTDLAEALGISLALLSHHSEVLLDAGVLRKERVGKLRVCTLDLERVHQATGGWIAGQTGRRNAPSRKASSSGRASAGGRARSKKRASRPRG